MRVIAGTHRSRIIKGVERETTRETKDRVKEAIFNTIGPYFTDEIVLDLFAGSGSLGIEAISRGAMKCTFVDSDKTAIDVITENVLSLKIQSNSLIVYNSYVPFLRSQSSPFDIIFLDPPYKLNVIDEIIQDIATQKLLKQDGIIVALYDKNSVIKSLNNGIVEYKQKTSGVTKVSYLKWGI
ncbi:MAG: 16S rRNA (guanine(966)-N(2))-methyltransferase RsmD [Firmicutes bacterium]|nr:16S rRNA (guanine(966)-N(2))-methyltransferase RsmD [Bacillota bacterium]